MQMEAIDAYYRTRRQVDNPDNVNSYAELTRTQRALYDYVDNEWEGNVSG